MHLPELVDRVARENRWATVHPAEKAMAAGVGVALASLHPWPGMAGVVIAVVLAAARRAGLPWTVLGEAATMPLGFLVAAALPLVVTIDIDAAHHIGFGAAGGRAARLALSRAAAVTACTLCLALTTPIHDLAWLARRLGAPAPLVVVGLATYRFVFQFARTLSALHAAQRARLGFIGWTGRLRSAAMVSASLFGRCLDGARALGRGLAARGGLSLGRGGFAALRPRVIGAILALSAALAIGGLR